ncbi:MAG: TauD/TfdA family dioxygenase [Actinobacteria bacterium]|nr:MAG: TauD/TfdA family dioxygenase [Actinomycetota bacterium]
MNDIPDLTRLDLRDPAGASRIVDALRRQGMAVFSGVGDRAALLRAGQRLMTTRVHRDSDGEGVTTIERRFPTATGSLAGFSERELAPHTDGSAVAEPPRILMMTCVRQPRSGGQSVLVDGCGLYREIAEFEPGMLDALREPRSAYFGGGSGYLGSVFEERDDHRVTVRLRFDGLIRFSPAASLYVGKLRELLRQRATTLDLAVGQGYILLNDRWLHGRRRFAGDRMMLRLIGDPLSEHRLAPGFAGRREPAAATEFRSTP